jgi:hypothetical protein
VRLRDAVERLPADLHDARHARDEVALGDEYAGPGARQRLPKGPIPYGIAQNK